MRNITLAEDVALKKFAYAPSGQRPHFNWASLVAQDSTWSLKIKDHDDAQTFSVADVAGAVGEAIIDLAVLRGLDNIYNDENCALVRRVCGDVQETLKRRVVEDALGSLSINELNLMIEDALVRNEAHDIARSFVFRNNNCFVPFAEADWNHIRLIRRNGKVVPWNPAKIEIAVRKAFLAQHTNPQPAATLVAQGVTRRLKETGMAFVHIEDVQDMVQEELMRQGYFKVAEAYILYRAQRAQLRATESTPKAEETQQASLVLIKSEKGDTFLWDGTELRKRIEFSSIGLDLSLNPEQVEKEMRLGLEAEMTALALKGRLLLNAQQLIEKDSEFDAFAARFYLSYLYEEVLGWDIQKDGIEKLGEFHKRHFKNYLKYAVKLGKLDKALLDYDLEKCAAVLDASADLCLDFQGAKLLVDQYLLSDNTPQGPRKLEVPQYFWMRVALGLFLNEPTERELWALRLYALLKDKRFCFSSNILLHAGTSIPAYASSYLYYVQDSLESIMNRGIAENAFITKWSGSVAGSWTPIRGARSAIQALNTETDGVLPFLKLHNAQLLAVQQEGKRPGAGCAYLEAWHSDIFEFQQLHRSTMDAKQRLYELGIGNWIPDLFMQRVLSNSHWTLFRTHEVPELHDLYGKTFEEKYTAYEKAAQEGKIWGKRVPALELWRHMLTLLFETGYPSVSFKDACNTRNAQKHMGVVHSASYCGENTLITSESETAACLLGAVVLSTHLNETGELQQSLLKETLGVALRALDNALDRMFFPTEPARTHALHHRPVGIGLMGLQDALYAKDLAYNSPEALAFNDQAAEALTYYAYLASTELAKERGVYATFKGSCWEKSELPMDTAVLLEKERGIEASLPKEHCLEWQRLRQHIAQHGMRHSQLVALSPTQNISKLMGVHACATACEKNVTTYRTHSGEYSFINRHLVYDLKRAHLWNSELMEQIRYFEGDLTHIQEIPDALKNKYRTAVQIPVEDQIEAAARRQRWIDQAQCLDIYLPFPDLKTLSNVYLLAWKKGIKTTRYLHTFGMVPAPCNSDSASALGL